MSSSGLKTTNFQNMTNDNKQQKLSDSTDTAIAYSTCYVQCGDNLELLKTQPNESVNMIYCDILYGTGRNFGNYQDLKPIRSDIESHYLPRLIEMKRVLKQNGSIYLQMDTRINHWMRILMDEVFGYKNFKNEISWGYSSGGGTKRKYASKHDIILFYTVSNEYTFNEPKMKVYQKKKYSFSTVKEYQDADGWYHLSTCSDFFNDIKTDWHNNMSLGLFKNNSDKKRDALYPTQKPKELIRRFVLASTNEGDVVADYYLGSGTTAKVCQELNRNFIGCDLSPKAIEITKARLNGGQ